MGTKLPILLFVISITWNCQSEKKSSSEADKEAIKQTLVDMWSAIENQDISKYAGFVHPDFTQFGETDSILRVGKVVEVKGVQSWIESSENIHTEMEDPRITVKNDVAWIVYYWKDHGTTDGEAFSTRGKSTRIFVKEKGKWLCIHGHYTSLP